MLLGLYFWFSVGVCLKFFLLDDQLGVGIDLGVVLFL